MKAAVRLALSLASIWGRGSAVETSSPVERIVNLLTTLKEKTVADGKVESDIYNRFACWCDKVLKLKADAIDGSRLEIRRTGQEILKAKGKIATLTSQVAALDKEIKENEEAQETATKMRAKANGEFQAQTTETKTALTSLQGALEVLIEGSSLLQTEKVNAILQSLQALPMSMGSIPQQHVSLLQEFASGKSASSYTPQSGTIQGILTNMYDTMSGDLEEATVNEGSSNRNFEEYMKQLADELARMKAERQQKEEQKTQTESLLADNTELYDDATETMKADIKFFDSAKESCRAKYDEWHEREELRNDEVAGFDSALEILTSDESREAFNSIKPGKETFFLQIESSRAPTEHAYAALKSIVAGSKNIQLAQLAVSVREAKVGHFDQVIKEIDGLMDVLDEEEKADIEKRDQCKQDYAAIELGSKDIKWRVEKSNAKIQKLTDLIEKREGEKAKTIAEIEDVQQAQTDMTSQREAENEAFKKSKADDEKSVEILENARTVLVDYYKKNNIDMGPIQGSIKGMFLQDEPKFEKSVWQAPDAVFSKKGSHKGESKNIVSFMTMLIEDLNDEIKNGIKAEEEAQLEYEKEMKAAAKLERELEAKKVSLGESISARTEEKNAEIETRDEEAEMLNSILEFKAQIKPDCDWILGAFDERRQKRDAERTGLRTAKDYLAGASVLQKGSKSSPRFLGTH